MYTHNSILPTVQPPLHHLLFVLAYNVAQTMHINKPNNEVHEIVFAELIKIKLNAMEMNLLETPKTVKLVADNNLRA